MVRFSLIISSLFIVCIIALHSQFLLENDTVFQRENLPRENEAEGEEQEDNFATTSSPSTASTLSEDEAEDPLPPPIEKEIALEPPNTTAEPIVPQPPPEVSQPFLSPDVLNEGGRAALVNILCDAESPLKSTSGSGVIIDPRGIILTNAHIAQYFLFKESPAVSCIIRSGSPALAKWRAKLIFIPQTWIEAHAHDVLNSKAKGTGEHDYALLAITESLDSFPLSTFPYIPLSSDGETIVVGDQILAAGYPAEFIGGSAARNALYISTVFTSLTQFLTFTENLVDVVSVSGTALAQSGSSGGGFISMQGTLIGLIVTTSLGETTERRDLHAITPEHINRSIEQHTGTRLSDFLARGIDVLASTFEDDQFDVLSQKLHDAVKLRQH